MVSVSQIWQLFSHANRIWYSISFDFAFSRFIRLTFFTFFVFCFLLERARQLGGFRVFLASIQQEPSHPKVCEDLSDCCQFVKIHALL